jgi:hypothetical protein
LVFGYYRLFWAVLRRYRLFLEPAQICARKTFWKFQPLFPNTAHAQVFRLCQLAQPRSMMLVMVAFLTAVAAIASSIAEWPIAKDG